LYLSPTKTILESQEVLPATLQTSIFEKNMSNRYSIIQADKASANIRPLVVDGAYSFKKEFAAVFNNQLTTAGQGEVEAVGAQGLQFGILTPGDVHGGK
jgi:hypothetical protein